MMEESELLVWQEKLAQAKRKIKAWEGEYKSTHGCAPNKSAMAEAPDEIKGAYKTYRYYRKTMETQPANTDNKVEGARASHSTGLTNTSSSECVSPSQDDDMEKSEDASVVKEANIQQQQDNCMENSVVLNLKCTKESPQDASVVKGDNIQLQQDNCIENSVVLNLKCTKELSQDASVVKGANIQQEEIATTDKGLIEKNCSPEGKNNNANNEKQLTSSFTWGKHLNKSNDLALSKENNKQSSLYSKMAERLRAGSTIKVRTSLKRSVNRSRQCKPLAACGKVTSSSAEGYSQSGKDIVNKVTVPVSSEESLSHLPVEMIEDNNSNSGAAEFLPPVKIDQQPFDSTNSKKLTGSSIFDSLEDDAIKLPSRQLSKKHQNTQAVSAISPLILSHSQTDTHTIKKRSSLNPGWLARCTGATLPEIVESNGQSHPSEDWKMRIIDKDWVDSDGDNEAECNDRQKTPYSSQSDGDNQDHDEYPESPPRKRTVKRNPRMTRKSNSSKTVSRQKVDSEEASGNDSINVPVQKKVRVLVEKFANGPDTGPTSPYDFDNECSEGDEIDRINTRHGKDEESAEEVDDSVKNIANEVGRKCSRKRKKETLEELEASGKIEFVWPPAKKKRIARKTSTKPIASVKRKKKENAETPARVQRPRRKREAAKPQPEASSKEESETHQLDPESKEYDETQEIESQGRKRVNNRGQYLSAEERLQKKVSSGTLNNNFVRINLKKKTFVRGKKFNMTGAKYKRQEWKKKQLMKSAEKGNAGAVKTLTCFRCGDFGHWAKKCPGKSGDSLMPLQEYSEDSTFLSLEEAASMAMGIKTGNSCQKPVTKVYEASSSSKEVQELEAGNKGEMSSTIDTGTDQLVLSEANELQESTEVNELQESTEANELRESTDANELRESTEANELQENTEAKELRESTEAKELRESTEANKLRESTKANELWESTEVNDLQESIEANELQESTEANDEPCTQSRDHTDVHLSSDEVHGSGENSNTDCLLDEDDDLFANLEVDNTPDRNVMSGGTNSLGSEQTASRFVHFDRPTVDPLYSLDNGKIRVTPDEVYETLRKFGYPSFRAGQEEAIMRVLSGQSTLLVLSTGSGKSLCYQLPAYLYAQHRSPCITLCVSPLVSLMEDQVIGLPSFLHAVCLHTHQNATQRSHALNAIESGIANILLVSPEAVVASRTGGVLGTLLKQLPPVALACLDEAHCVSEWSHNFRPSYLRVCQVLRERLGVRTILGLTATARQVTAVSIARHLLVPDFDTGVIRGTSVPVNLHMSVSRDQHREQALISLLQGERLSNCDSIIVYCTRRDECERVATLIRTQLLDPSKVDVKSNLKRTRGISFDAEAYHAGLSSHRRQKVQKHFMSGNLRIVVATVAFGMGIDKSDVRGIIHFNMPRNVESYVQEIGRAGRDGEDAHCHLFLDNQDGTDIQELKRHIYANSIDRHTVRKLLDKIFKPCTCAKVKNLEVENDKTESDGVGEECLDKTDIESPTPKLSLGAVSEGNENENTTESSSMADPFSVSTIPSSCPKHEVAIPIENLVEELDIPEENIETLLCYLELHQGNLIHITSHVYANCTVSCYGGPRQLVAVSRRCPPLAVAIALERQKGINFDKLNIVSFPVVEVASRMGWSSNIVKRELKSLEWNTQDLNKGGKIKRSGVTVEFTDLSFHLDACGDLSNNERDQVLDALYRRCKTQERDQLFQLMYTYRLLRQTSHNSIMFCCDDWDSERCDRLRTELKQYFSTEGTNMSDVHLEEKLYIRPEIEGNIRSSVRAFISTHTDHQWTGRAVARVFHGIGSPNFPPAIWGRVRRFWRLHLNTDFSAVVKFATQEILRCK